MGTGPLKKELESIDQELESAMLRLSESTQRVDDLLADYNADDGGGRRASAFTSLRSAASDEAAHESDDETSDTEITEDSDSEENIEENDATESSSNSEDATED